MGTHVIVSARIRLETGPTIVGDERSDPELMGAIGAKMVREVGNDYSFWQVFDPPRIILDRLNALGFRIIGMSGVGQTCIWTMYKELPNTAASVSTIRTSGSA